MELSKEYIDSLKKVKNLNIEKLKKCFDSPAEIGVRFNTKKLRPSNINQKSIKEFVKDFDVDGNFEMVPWCKTGFYASPEMKLGKNILHELGVYYMQEPSAMSPAEFLGIKKDDIVLDLCAAPGGKSTQIAQKLDGGFLVSNEIVPKRAKILLENVERLGLDNVIVTNHSPKELEIKFENFFDKILVDAPCSGEGMFRKNSDAANEWNENSPKICAARQKEIMSSAYTMLKPGGTLVYSTCTFSLEENEEVIESLLEQFDDLEILPVEHEKFGFEKGIAVNENSQLTNCARLYPYNLKGEGHFFAVLKKRENWHNERKNYQKKPENKQKIAIFEQFIKDFSKNEYRDYIFVGDFLYANCRINIDKLKVESAGLLLGEFKKNVFIPSFHLARSLKDFKTEHVQELSYESAKKYIEGFELQTNLSDGWALLTYKNFPISFGKCVNGEVKNHYPKNMRKKL